MKAQIFLTLVIALLSSLAVQANEIYQQTLVRLDKAAQSFVSDNDYINQSVETLTGSQYYSEKTFPELSSNSTQTFHIDADLDALTRSLLILEAQEFELPHVRYHIHYSENTDTEIPELTHSYIEVTRYNLGPTLRNDLLQHLDAGNVADVSEFGVGPHVSWRFAMAPVMGMQADVIYAARKEIPDSYAQQTMCFSQSCLSLEATELPSTQTHILERPLLSPAKYRAESAYGVLQPARMLEELWAAFASDESLPYIKNQPQFVFVISANVVGQEHLTLGTGLQAMVLDDAIGQVWLQSYQVAGMKGELLEALIAR